MGSIGNRKQMQPAAGAEDYRSQTEISLQNEHMADVNTVQAQCEWM